MKTTTALIVIFYLFVLHCYSQENDSIHARIENNYLQYLKEDKYTSLYRMKNKRLLRTLHSAITELNIQEKGNVYILNYYIDCNNWFLVQYHQKITLLVMIQHRSTILVLFLEYLG